MFEADNKEATEKPVGYSILKAPDNPLKSIVVWTNWEVGGRSIIVPISIDSQGKITLVNDIKTMFDAGENYYDGFIKAGVLYTKNNEDIKQLLSSRRHMPAAMADDVFADILSKAGEDVNKNVDYGYSSVSPNEDAEYMSLATKQNRTEDENARIQQMLETAADKSMPNSKLRDKNGKLMLFYHGTNQGDYTVFDWNETQRADAGFFGRGHYFAYTKNGAELYGDREIKAYLLQYYRVQ